MREMIKTEAEKTRNKGNANRLVLTVGLPKSGKTTWALTTGWPIVCPDAIRLALHGERFLNPAEEMVWTIAHYMVRALFLAGHRAVILDATNITRERRDRWRNPEEWDTFYKFIGTPEDECVRRANAEGDYVIVPIIENMAKRFEPLGPDEPKLEFSPWGCS